MQLLTIYYIMADEATAEVVAVVREKMARRAHPYGVHLRSHILGALDADFSKDNRIRLAHALRVTIVEDRSSADLKKAIRPRLWTI